MKKEMHRLVVEVEDDGTISITGEDDGDGPPSVYLSVHQVDLLIQWLTEAKKLALEELANLEA